MVRFVPISDPILDRFCFDIPSPSAFTFYFQTEKETNDSTLRLSNDDIQRTFTNIGNRRVTCVVDNDITGKDRCYVLSLPFKFDHLINITNNFPNVVFNYVTRLALWNVICFFPFLLEMSDFAWGAAFPPKWNNFPIDWPYCPSLRRIR